MAMLRALAEQHKVFMFSVTEHKISDADIAVAVLRVELDRATVSGIDREPERPVRALRRQRFRFGEQGGTDARMRESLCWAGKSSPTYGL